MTFLPADTISGDSSVASQAEEPGEPDADTAARRDRLAVALVGDDGFLDATEAACAAAGVSEVLPSDSFELLVGNIETIDEIEEGTQFTDDEVLSISRAFAACADFGDLVDQIADNPEGIALLACLRDDVGDDEVEAFVLFEVLGDNGEGRGSPSMTQGLRGGCADVARTVVDQSVLDLYLSEDQPPIIECLPSISNDELLPIIERGDINALERFITERCQ